MIDYVTIKVKAGNGGKGAGSFTHIKGKRRGKADGGDGGTGGSVLLVATHDLNTLEPFRYIKLYEAKNGENGLSKRRKGASGADLEVWVPVGTVIKIQNSPFDSKLAQGEQFKIQNYDLTEEGQRALVARGGEGGRGNAHLRDQFGRRPFAGESGQEGEKVDLVLELKMIADVGICGLPNAGKSTLLAALTLAKPEVAAYPFTTLEPNLGVMDFKEISNFPFDSKLAQGEQFPISNKTGVTRSRLILADIPGLIEGASRGRGLGDLFLRHIERTKVLVHLIDVSCPSDHFADYRVVREELKIYSKELLGKKEIIALNKIDLANEETVRKTAAEFKAKRKKVYPISAQTKAGLDELVGAIVKAVSNSNSD